MLAYFLIVTFFGGLGYQLRRWFGKQRWYMGLLFVAVLYVPGFTAALFGLIALGFPFEAARRLAGSPVLGGLVIGALFLCASNDWASSFSGEVPDTSEELGATNKGETQKRKDLDGRKTATQQDAGWGTLAPVTWKTVMTAAGGTVLLIGLVIALRGPYTNSVGESSSSPKPLPETREVRVDLTGVPSEATVQVPATFTPASSPRQRAREALAFVAVWPDEANRSMYSKLLLRNWEKGLHESTILAIGQPGNMKGHQGKLTPTKWRAVLEKSQEMSNSDFRSRLDALQSQFRGETDVSSKPSTPAVTVRNGRLIVYRIAEVERDDKNLRQLRARKVMYESGYVAAIDMAVGRESTLPVDSLRCYVKAISFSVK
ncbi:hypothetical protein [Salinibacter sp.]|uniref:hypothetical protein n=1 Tax=Salinibacter sp. TaxID=2065818 RepID=UPI0021E847D5|nr:hypothetical protein [Salinibacter sp.]